MKNLLSYILLLCGLLFIACSNTGQKKNWSTTNRLAPISLVDESRLIDTIAVVDDTIEQICNDRWIGKTLDRLRQNGISYEAILVENLYSEIQDSMLVFGGNDFKYSFLKVTHLDKLILEYFEENNLDSRPPLVGGVGERARSLVGNIETASSGEYVIHITNEPRTSNVFLGMEDNTLVSIKYIGFVD